MMATTTPTKQASHKSHTPLHYDSDSKFVTTPVKLKKSKPVHVPVSAGAPKPPQPKPIQVPVPAPSFAGATEEKFSSAPNAFASFRVMSKRYRTMSGASAEALDGTNAGVCPTFKKKNQIHGAHVWRSVGEHCVDFSGKFDPKPYSKTTPPTRPPTSDIRLEKQRGGRGNTTRECATTTTWCTF
jgi:hypothetical protein